MLWTIGFALLSLAGFVATVLLMLRLGRLVQRLRPSRSDSHVPLFGLAGALIAGYIFFNACWSPFEPIPRFFGGESRCKR